MFAEEVLLVLMLVGRLAMEALVAFQVGEADREGAFQMAWMDLISLNTPTWLKIYQIGVPLPQSQKSPTAATMVGTKPISKTGPISNKESFYHISRL